MEPIYKLGDIVICTYFSDKKQGSGPTWKVVQIAKERAWKDLEWVYWIQNTQSKGHVVCRVRVCQIDGLAPAV